MTKQVTAKNSTGDVRKYSRCHFNQIRDAFALIHHGATTPAFIEERPQLWLMLCMECKSKGGGGVKQWPAGWGKRGGGGGEGSNGLDKAGVHPRDELLRCRPLPWLLLLRARLGGPDRSLLFSDASSGRKTHHSNGGDLCVSPAAAAAAAAYCLHIQKKLAGFISNRLLDPNSFSITKFPFLLPNSTWIKYLLCYYIFSTERPAAQKELFAIWAACRVNWSSGQKMITQ